jgi:hypothetical protein
MTLDKLNVLVVSDKRFMSIINIAAMNNLVELASIANMLRFDSVFDIKIGIDENNNLLIINKELRLKIYSKNL